MPLRKTIRLLASFYKNFFLLNTLITGVCLVLFLEYGFPIFTILLLLKLITLGMVFIFVRAYKSKEFYYYHNLGLSKRRLWAATLGFDLCLYFVLLFVANKISA